MHLPSVQDDQRDAESGQRRLCGWLTKRASDVFAASLAYRGSPISRRNSAEMRKCNDFLHSGAQQAKGERERETNGKEGKERGSAL